jgi:hypothetical protein
MNILEKIREWFEGPKENELSKPLPNVGQQAYHSQTADVDVQAQVQPIELNPIPVDVCGIVPVWSMPSKHQIFKQSSQGSTRAQALLDADYKWKRVTLWVTGVVAGQVQSGVFIGNDGDLNGNSVWGAQLPIDKPVVIEGLHAALHFMQTQASITANGALSINYIAERWAD